MYLLIQLSLGRVQRNPGIDYWTRIRLYEGPEEHEKSRYERLPIYKRDILRPGTGVCW